MLPLLSLACFVYLPRAGYSTGVQWLAGALLIAAALIIVAIGLITHG